MIEISYREYWRNFGKYKSGEGVVRVVGRGGEVIGHWYPSGTEWIEEGKPTGGEVLVKEVISPTKVVGSFVQNAASEKFFGNKVPISNGLEGAGVELPKVRDFGKPMCYFCNKLIAEYEIMHEEAEGFVERLGCCLCFKKSKSTNFKKL